MGPVYGIKNLLPLILLSIELGNVADKFGRKKGVGRYLTLVDLADEVIDLRNVDFSQVKKEVSELDESEKKIITDAVKEKLDLVDDSLEIVIEDFIVILERQVAVVSDSLALYKKLKAPKEVAA